jgi:hypothetical protein
MRDWEAQKERGQKELEEVVEKKTFTESQQISL